jgi:hypothetical protein
MRVRSLLGGAALTALVAACSGSTSLDGVTLWRHGLLAGSPAAIIGGRLDFTTGCVGIAPEEPGFETLVVVWPMDAHLERLDGEVVIEVGGIALQRGDEVAIAGGEYDADTIEAVAGPIPRACAGVSDRYWLAGETKRGLP